MKEKSPAKIFPRHIAIIMDGNGRWAKERHLPRLQGHGAGAENVRRITTAASELGIEYLTLYAFSAENWKRPQHEVSGLMSYLKYYLKNELPLMQKNNIRFLFKIRFYPALKRLTLNGIFKRYLFRSFFRCPNR